jgi:nitrite reductase (NADH) small subunit
MRWTPVCRFEEILPDTGICALVEERQVAVFRVADRLYALDNRDPFSGANVLARGIVGDSGGVLKVSSPMYKHSFALATGACLDDPAVSIARHPVRVRDGLVEVGVAAAPAPPVVQARRPLRSASG